MEISNEACKESYWCFQYSRANLEGAFRSYGRVDPIRAENETTNTYKSNEWPMYSSNLPKPEGTIMKFNELS
jgi:hypothetical protein